MNDRPALEARTELGLQSRSALFFHSMIPSFGRNSTPQGLLVPGRPWLMVLALLACSWTAGAREYSETLSARSEGRRIEGSLDWTNGILTVSGEAAAPAGLTDPARRRLAGFTAARETAYRNLAVIAGEVPVGADTRVKGATLADKRLAVKLDGLVKAARVDLRSRRERDGLFRLALKLNLRGRFSDAVLPDSTLELLPPGELPAADSLLLFTTQETSYTGLVVDARGTGLKPCMAPRIIDASGRVIFSVRHAGRNCSVYDGVAGYENDLRRAAKSSRVGGPRARPLIIEADGSSGSLSGDATVSRDLGTRVLMAALESDFLSQCGVVFVLGPKPEPPFVLVRDPPRLDTGITAATDSVQVDSVAVDSAPDPYDLHLYRLLGTDPPLPPLADTVGFFDFDELFREAGRGDGE